MAVKSLSTVLIHPSRARIHRRNADSHIYVLKLPVTAQYAAENIATDAADPFGLAAILPFCGGED
ncbi:hypothetical protein JXO59_07665, partial [candidate division KSB1 bacterium]|nr:hypothetical protein [candidate division KSB1 bacterium]